MSFKVGDRVIAEGIPPGTDRSPMKIIGTVRFVGTSSVDIKSDDGIEDWFWEFNQVTLVDEKKNTQYYKQLIEQECDALKALLLEKNVAYGSSIFEPVRIFSKADTEEQILTRIDDKISRIQRGKEYQNDDTVTDLVGYLLMLKIYRKINKK